jgi:hypothetical protein
MTTKEAIKELRKCMAWGITVFPEVRNILINAAEENEGRRLCMSHMVTPHRCHECPAYDACTQRKNGVAYPCCDFDDNHDLWVEAAKKEWT